MGYIWMVIKLKEFWQLINIDIKVALNKINFMAMDYWSIKMVINIKEILLMVCTMAMVLIQADRMEYIMGNGNMEYIKVEVDITG